MTGPGNQPLPLLELYQVLLSHNGCQNWWPAQTRDEVIIGAILTQSVAWGNVEKALVALAGQGILTLRDIHLADLQLLATLVRPTLYYNQKALRLKEFARFLGDTCGFDLDILFSEELSSLRARMLSISVRSGTVDSILLYVGGLPVFVVDAYTKGYCRVPGYPIEKLITISFRTTSAPDSRGGAPTTISTPKSSSTAKTSKGPALPRLSFEDRMSLKNFLNAPQLSWSLALLICPL